MMMNPGLAAGGLQLYRVLVQQHMATSILYPNGATRQGRSPRKGLALAGAGPASQPLTFIDRPWPVRHSLIPHFYRQALGQARPPTPQFYWRSLWTTGPWPARPQPPSVGQTHHFCQPGPSLVPARPGRRLASGPDLSVDRSPARNLQMSKIDTAT